MIAKRMNCGIFLLTLGFAVVHSYGILDPHAGPPPCLQEIAKGNCKGYLEQWALDQQSGKCIRFIYTGCGGNQNRYKDEKSCLEQCSFLASGSAANIDEQKAEPETKPFPPLPPRPRTHPVQKPGIDRCYLPVAPGNCKRHQNVYHFDSSSGQCKRFVYTGCRGNQNRFRDEKECLAKCGNKVPIVLPAIITKPEGGENNEPNVKPAANSGKCLLPVEKGKCRLYEPSWHYDANEFTCKRFIYSGCQGNDNRFATEESCLAECAVRRDQPPILLPTYRPRPEIQPTYRPRPHIQPTYRPRPEIQPTYRPRPEIQPTYRPRPEIQPTRRPVPPLGPEILPIFVGPQCSQKPDPGMCMAHMPKWHYDDSTGNCLSFIYGGCGGNDNRYPTEQACLDACKPSRNPKPLGPELIDRAVNSDKCSQPLAAGNCKAYINAWHFDNAAGRCKPFVYTGCKGNDNRFGDEKSCQNACSSKSPVIAPNKDINAKCLLPVAVGRCKARIPAWHFDDKTGTCKSFNYSGCQGNENRFADERTCQNTCRSVEEVKVNHGY